MHIWFISSRVAFVKLSKMYLSPFSVTVPVAITLNIMSKLFLLIRFKSLKLILMRPVADIASIANVALAFIGATLCHCTDWNRKPLRSIHNCVGKQRQVIVFELYEGGKLHVGHHVFTGDKD